ncbi:5-methylthioadenosine/S-adenosylhomocysteine deaminase [Dissulfurispira thermophila]|uniref:5-methylthioadenosine/S-adenosylhomocysteine deaminase n=1 Tax=Dissulfurispira thermophila TaxID=2715679 RepID=A0A7G1H3B8_9BACT|nr:amidohydrolase [Dissulfurispira thermophila]BCB96613.1 5-methylthioadenosine/S-adenosylhomocysteine deaminase [Dissulfurispira thermophila]
MQRADYIICGDYVLTMNDRMDSIKDGAIAVKGAEIIDVDIYENISKKYSSENIVGGKGRAVLPGLINTHTHAAMVYFRGLADDMPLNDWLKNYIWPAENEWLSNEFVFDASQLACLEMLKAGVTTFNDMYFFCDSVANAAEKIGMRAVIGAGIVDFPTKTGNSADDYINNAERFIEKWKKGVRDELITPCIAPHSTYTCSSETLKKSKKIAERLDVLLHIHLSETEWEVSEVLSRYGKRPIEYLHSIGFLDERVVAAHCVWVEDREIEMLANHKVGVSHCIESNLKLASGFAPVGAMLKSGVRVTFGTDGAASNNDLNILGEMSTAAKVHKAVLKDSVALDARTIITMATRWGAEVLGLGKSVGSIEKGKLADIITINLKVPHLAPIYDVYSHIVYAVMASDIETVMVNGRLLINNRMLITADENSILQKAFEWGRKISLWSNGVKG